MAQGVLAIGIPPDGGIPGVDGGPTKLTAADGIIHIHDLKVNGNQGLSNPSGGVNKGMPNIADNISSTVISNSGMSAANSDIGEHNHTLQKIMVAATIENTGPIASDNDGDSVSLLSITKATLNVVLAVVDDNATINASLSNTAALGESSSVNDIDVNGDLKIVILIMPNIGRAVKGVDPIGIGVAGPIGIGNNVVNQVPVDACNPPVVNLVMTIVASSASGHSGVAVVSNVNDEDTTMAKSKQGEISNSDYNSVVGYAVTEHLSNGGVPAVTVDGGITNVMLDGIHWTYAINTINISGSSIMVVENHQSLTKTNHVGVYDSMLDPYGIHIVNDNYGGSDMVNAITSHQDGYISIGMVGDDAPAVGIGNNTTNVGDGNDASIVGNGNNESYGGVGNDPSHSGSGNDSSNGGIGSDIVSHGYVIVGAMADPSSSIV